MFFFNWVPNSFFPSLIDVSMQKRWKSVKFDNYVSIDFILYDGQIQQKRTPKI